MEGRSLRDAMLECVDDLEGITKQIVDSLLNRDKHKKEGESLTNLVALYEGKHKDMKTLTRKIPEYQEREKLIGQLTACVGQRDKIIHHVESIIRSAETAVMKSVYRSNKRLQSVRHSELRSVDSEEVIKFAHQISRGYSIATPHYWKQGDPQRPFPTEPEFRASRLSAPRAPPTSNAINMIRNTTTTNVRTPPAGLRMSSPMVAPPVANKSWGSPSPRPSYANSSPRVRPPLTTPGGSNRGSESSPYNGKKYSTGSPRISSPNVAISIQSTVARPMQQVMAVETMSSDSSSSSSSEDEGQS